MYSGIDIVGHNIAALDTIAEQVFLSREAFMGRAIRLGLTLGNLVLEAGGEPVYVIFEQPDGVGNRYEVEFEEVVPPELPSDLPPAMQALDAQLEPTQRLALDISSEDLDDIDEMAAKLGVDRQAFLERSLGFAHLWSMTAMRDLEILIEDQYFATDGYRVPDVAFF